MDDKLKYAVERVRLESPVNGAVVAAALEKALARSSRLVRRAASLTHSPQWPKRNAEHRLGGYRANCSACRMARKILELER